MAAEVRPPHRVLLVREWDQQVGGSGCCGRLNTASIGAICETADSPFARSRIDMEKVGEVYRALRERFPPDQVELTVVDPRNTLWLLPTIWRDARRRGLPVSAALRQVSRATSACALVCDGAVLLTDPTPQEAVAAVEADLLRDERTTNPPRRGPAATARGGSRPAPPARATPRSPSPRS